MHYKQDRPLHIIVESDHMTLYQISIITLYVAK